MAEAALIVRKLLDRTFILYVLASVCALAVDVGSFLALMSLGVAAAFASFIGYSLGILAHWLISSRAVFHAAVAEGGAERTKQKTLFVVSALVGLGLTTGIVGLSDWAGFDPRIAKCFAILVSFTATWLLRSKIVFRAQAGA